MKMFTMGFESNIREIRKNYAELIKNNEVEVKPSNLKGLMDYIFESVGTNKSVTITPITDGHSQYFVVKF